MRARTMASSEANGSSISKSFGRSASTCASATRLRWPPLRCRGNRCSNPASPSRASQASASLSAACRSMPWKPRPSATLSRAVRHGSSASSWNRMPSSDGATSVSTRPASGFCNPITARSRLDLPEPDGPTRLTNWPSPTSRLAPSSTGSAPYEIERSRTRRAQPPTTVVSCRPLTSAPAGTRPAIFSVSATRLAAGRSIFTLSG